MKEKVMNEKPAGQKQVWNYSSVLDYTEIESSDDEDYLFFHLLGGDPVEISTLISHSNYDTTDLIRR
jgi:hypothetical protein